MGICKLIDRHALRHRRARIIVVGIVLRVRRFAGMDAESTLPLFRMQLQHDPKMAQKSNSNEVRVNIPRC
jgi:hypothetical protein